MRGDFSRGAAGIAVAELFRAGVDGETGGGIHGDVVVAGGAFFSVGMGHCVLFYPAVDCDGGGGGGENPEEMKHRGTEARRGELNDLSRRVIGACIEIHRELGPGLLESVYEESLVYELSQAGMKFERQKSVPIRYKNVLLGSDFRLDLLVEDELIVELKTVAELLPIHEAQLLTYLRLEQKALGLLINFNVPVLRDGVKRVVVGNLFLEKLLDK